MLRGFLLTNAGAARALRFFEQLRRQTGKRQFLIPVSQITEVEQQG